MQGAERHIEGNVFSLMGNLGVVFNFLIKSSCRGSQLGCWTVWANLIVETLGTRIRSSSGCNDMFVACLRVHVERKFHKPHKASSMG